MTDIRETLTARGKTYGRFFSHATIAQELKQIVLEAMGRRWVDLAPDQREALEMILHKIARVVNGDPNHVDSWHDIAGYATLVADRLRGSRNE